MSCLSSSSRERTTSWVRRGGCAACSGPRRASPPISICRAHVRAARELTLQVDDDGRGIGTPTRASGLANMRQRAEALGGSLELESAPDGGTRVTWRAPARR